MIFEIMGFIQFDFPGIAPVKMPNLTKVCYVVAVLYINFDVCQIDFRS